ncbi:MAG: hypothetical protein M3P34_09075 [Actinomycetota bacterium]|nr:hypothetical protein [Actinomycetota bacterium]
MLLGAGRGGDWWPRVLDETEPAEIEHRRWMAFLQLRKHIQQGAETGDVNRTGEGSHGAFASAGHGHGEAAAERK